VSTTKGVAFGHAVHKTRCEHRILVLYVIVSKRTYDSLEPSSLVVSDILI
jgi:hypothetical protein